MRRWIAWLMCVLFALPLFACRETREETPGLPAEVVDAGPDNLEQVAAALERRGGYRLRAAVLYSGRGGGAGWQATLDYLRQPLVVNLEAEAVDAGGAFDLTGYDLVYLDESLLSLPDLEAVCRAVEDFTAAGGAVLAPNGFHGAFSPAYFGVSAFEKVEGFPGELTLPQGLGDLTGLQTVAADFHELYQQFSAFREDLAGRDYGWAAAADTAVPLVLSGGQALYTVNHFGAGWVFFVSPLLPNAFIQSAFSMTAQAGQAAFASSAASFNQLLLSEWAAFVSKQLYGFALERVFGSYGSPSMSWECHYEEITGIENGALQRFSRLAEENRQIPSFTLIRSSYQWFLKAETLTYLMNGGEAGEPDFQMDFNESAYSSGVHIDCGGGWLSLAQLENGESYFEDHPEQRLRLYPCAVDYNGDGLTDFFCGSSDGGVYYYQGRGLTGLDGRLAVDEPQRVTVSGTPMALGGGYAAPQVLDVDGDGWLDLVVGGVFGSVYWYKGSGTTDFTDQGVLLRTDFPGQSLPAAGDVDGDGVTDLLVGSNQGLLVLYYGEKDGAATRFSHDRMEAYSRDCADLALGAWLAPALADWNGDGAADLLVGTFDGYIARFLGDGQGGFAFDGYVDADEKNYKGNAHLKFGNYCTPAFTDLNGDGAADLLAGCLEYGLAYPIDSPYFAFRSQLQEQLDYAADHHYYMGVHFYTNAYASPEREAWELSAHRSAMAAYGVDTEGAGANQHTWYTSSLNPAQTMKSLWNAGLLWQSGFGSSGDPWPAPQSRAENAVAYPFFLTEGEERTLLVQNTAVLPYRAEWTELSGRYQMPVCIFYHCDFIYNSDEEARRYIEQVSDFQRAYGYTFAREDQLMRASAAAYNLTVEVSAGAEGITLIPGHASEEFPLYDEAAQGACGVRIDISGSLPVSLTTDARVWKRTENGLALGLDGPVTVTFTAEAPRDGTHIEQVNIPANIAAGETGAVIAFTGGGMLQAAVFGQASTADEGWTVDQWNGRTVFTKFGGADTLHIDYQ